jgi:hypothetical protein
VAFDGVIGSIAEAWRLPHVQDFNPTVPVVIRDRLNLLYQGLAHLDYRRRIGDFGRIFKDLEVCIRLLDYEAAYRRYLELRRRRRAAREAKRRRDEDRSVGRPR